MQLGTFFNIAIGLVLLYLVLSLACTTINELIASALKLRANQLKAAITQLIDDPNLRGRFYQQGAILSAKVAADPSAVQKMPNTLPTTNVHPSYLESADVARALLASLIAQPVPDTDAIKAAVDALPDGNIKRVLQDAVASAAGNVAAVETNLANWFDGAMDRLSGLYTRQLKLISLIVGLAIAVAFNADSLAVGQAIWTDPGVQQQVVTTAAGAAQADLSGCDPNASLDQESNCALAKLSSLESKLRPFPLGWSRSGMPAGDDWLGWTILKILGIAWTAIAVSLGAPFWFDVLQSFMNLRGSTKPKAT